MEVEHVVRLETDIAPKVFANNALPGGEESFIEQFLELFGQVNVLELARSGCFLLHELNCLQSHIYRAKLVIL